VPHLRVDGGLNNVPIRFRIQRPLQTHTDRPQTLVRWDERLALLAQTNGQPKSITFNVKGSKVCKFLHLVVSRTPTPAVITRP
jgi:hypothetical protein